MVDKHFHDKFNSMVDYNLDKLNKSQCKIDNLNLVTSNLDKVCNWEMRKNVISSSFIYKDIDDGALYIVKIEIFYCSKKKIIVKSQVTFDLGAINKTYILDLGQNLTKLEKLNNFLELLIPYQDIWIKDYIENIESYQNNIYFFDEKTNKLSKKNILENFVSVKNNITNNHMDLDNSKDVSLDDYNYKLPKDYVNLRHPVPDCWKKFAADRKCLNRWRFRQSNNRFDHIENYSENFHVHRCLYR